MGVLVLLVVLFLINEQFFKKVVAANRFVSIKLLRRLFFYHLVIAFIYYLYAYFNPSDSKGYFDVLSKANLEWADTIDMTNWGVLFIGFPLVKYLSFDFEMCMLFFSWLGFIGFVYAYLFFAENITEKVTVFGRYDLLTLLLFLPNMHFWSSSLGKGSVIFLGIMMFVYGVKKPKQRIFQLILGGFLMYCIRPHILLFVLVGVMFGLFFGRDKKISKSAKFFIVVAGVVCLYLASNSILAVADLQNSENVVDDFEQFSEQRSIGLLKTAGSGVDMSNYPLPFKFFTFWFRPLFIDSPSALGIFSSLENLIYLFLFAKILNKRFLRFITKSPFMVKMAAITFLTTSFAMTFVMSNLGIIMRQKSMVMYFAFFVIYYFLANEKWLQMQKRKAQTVVS